MIILYFDNLTFSIINAQEPKISNKYIDYNLFYYTTFYTKTLWPGLKNIKLYYPICVSFLTFIVVIIHFTKSYIKRCFMKTTFYRKCLAISHSFNRFNFFLNQCKLRWKKTALSYWNNSKVKNTFNNIIQLMRHPFSKIVFLGISIFIFYFTIKVCLLMSLKNF
jgi:hypothetical protein